MRKLVSSALAASVLVGTLAVSVPANAQYWGPPLPPPIAWGPPSPPYGYDGWRQERYWQWQHERERAWRHREWCRWHGCW
ncbi:MAG TPA: hypothetical protein VF503_13840 [Sphingobium sp.]|uniref:hypothetical protein n=1 Tax=Sphingobium sp. TaxID=1912891 RepID=UPI002ED02158